MIVDFVAIVVIIALVFGAYLLGKRHSESLKSGELTEAVTALQDLKSQIAGEHSAVVSEKDRMISSASSVTQKLIDWATVSAERVTTINTSLTSISQQAVEEVKKMSGVIQPVIAMFKTPQTAGVQFAEAELEVLLKTHLGDSLYERKPSWLAVGSEAVDFIIKLPDCVIPIDSKFPEAVYRSWIDVQDGEGEAKVRWRKFRDAVLQQLEITSKYIRPEASTTDYALLFLPSDVIWEQAFLVSRWYGEDNPIPRRSQELRVFGCSAQTLMPYIGLLRLGLRNLKVAEDVKAVRQQIDQLKTSFERFARDWSVLRKHLWNAQSTALEVEGARGSFAGLQRDVERLTSHEQVKVVTLDSEGSSAVPLVTREDVSA